MMGRSLEISFLSCVALSSPASGYLGPSRWAGWHHSTPPAPLWGNLCFQTCQTRFREEWLQLWHKKMVQKYQLESWGIDWWCWRVAPLSVHSVHLKIFCCPRRGEDCSAAGVATAELWFRSPSGKSALDFSLFLPKIFLRVRMRVFVLVTSAIASCIPILQNCRDIHVWCSPSC